MRPVGRIATVVFAAGLSAACTTATAPSGSLVPAASERPTPTPVPGDTAPTGLIAFEVEIGIDGATSKNIFTIRPDGSGLRAITHLEAGYAYHPALSGDGRRIVYGEEDHHRPSSWNASSSHLIIANSDGSDPSPLTAGREYDTAPTVSPDGRWVAFTRQIGDDRSAIFLVRSDGSASRQLTNPPRPESDNFPSFSPDGRQVAFDRGGAVYTISTNGSGTPKRVTPRSVDAQYARWSPDGRQILFEADGLHVINVDGSGLADLGIGGSADWSPDGQWIAFQRWTPGTNYFALVVARADGSGAKEIWTTPPATDTFVVYVDWGPDAS